MPAAARQTDPDTSDGSITSSTATTVIINGLEAAVVGSVDSAHSPYGPPHPPHEAATIVAGSDSVIVEGQPLARVGDPLSCGHSIAAGSPDVEVG
tara:strand:+ start:26523 stop:26807 length:285 start_codon:yes stop_codon:yes gene_type:complete